MGVGSAKSPIPSTSTSIPSGLTEATTITPLKNSASHIALSQVTPVTTHPPIKKTSTVRRRVVPKGMKRKEFDSNDDFDESTSPQKPGKINSQNQQTPLLNQSKQTSPVIDNVYSNDNNPNPSSAFKNSLNIEYDKGQQQQLGKSDRMSKEKQKFFRHSAFNSERIVKTSPPSIKSHPSNNATKLIGRNLKNQLETIASDGYISTKQKQLSDTSSTCTSSDDEETTSSGSCSSSSSDNSDSSSSSQSSSSDDENETNDKETHSWTKNAAGGKSNVPTQKVFSPSSNVDVNGTWGFAAEAKKNFDIFQKNTVQPERVFGNFDGIDKESLVKVDKTKASNTVKDRPPDGRSSGQLKGLFDSLSHVFSTTDYTRSRQGAPPNYKLGIRRKKQKEPLDGPPRVVLKETRSTFRDYKEQRLQEQNRTNQKTEFNSFLNASNNKVNNCSISVSNNTEAKEQFAKKYFTSDNNTKSTLLPTTDTDTNDLTSLNSPSKIARRITPMTLPLERRNVRYHSSSEDEVPYLKPRLTPSNLVKNAINSQSQDARQKSSQLKQTSDQKLFGALSKKNSMDFASFRDSSTKLSSCTPPPYNNNQSMGKKIKTKTTFFAFHSKQKAKETTLCTTYGFFIIYYAILLTTISYITK